MHQLFFIMLFKALALPIVLLPQLFNQLVVVLPRDEVGVTTNYQFPDAAQLSFTLLQQLPTGRIRQLQSIESLREAIVGGSKQSLSYFGLLEL